MWVYQFGEGRQGTGTAYQIGYLKYHQNGFDQFVAVEYADTAGNAARRVNYLNGGEGMPYDWNQPVEPWTS